MPHKVFRTVIEPEKFNFEINHKSKLLFIGSCFTENIGNLLKKLKFDIDINPFGILYNPVSVYNALKFISENKRFTKDDLFYFNERWNSYYHHGRFSSNDSELALDKINSRTGSAYIRFPELNYIFITFGTAWVYRLKESGQIVSNCHKVPATQFEKILLNVENVYNYYSEIIKKLTTINNKLKVIFTISPVRHLKDGFEENFLSKSILRTAINDIINKFDNCFYFPSYEIVTDDLRDYRFYNSDMVHPSEEATDYIFNFFSKSFFADETISFNEMIIKIIKAAEHRPINVGSDEYLRFKKKISEKIKQLKADLPYIIFDDETEFFG